ncbi:MAG: BamA/TamA family outer membrane protein [Gemmatimonadetes bacterium]|nr:BamA/TamA family outer membrane protein [Gemmatimonadota bacterium]
MLCGFLLVLCAPRIAVGAESAAFDSTEAPPEAVSVAGELARKRAKRFPPRLVVGRLIYLPKVYYSSTSGFGIGGQVIAPFRCTGSADTTPLSDYRAKGRITHKGQGKIETTANLFLGENVYYAKVRLAYTDLAFDYFGIGPNTPRSNAEEFRPRNYFAYVEFFRRVLPALRVGVRTEANLVESISFEPEGLIASDQLADQTNSRVFGFGGVIDLNTTDKRYAPTDGIHWQMFGLWFDKDAGSEFDFNQYVIDLRNYIGLRRNHVLATQLFLFGTDGHVPFFRLGQLGGHTHSRGYKQARYRDKILASFQAEYRYPIYRRLGFTTFAGGAVVAPEVAGLKAKYLRPTVGMGLQFRTESLNGIVGRADVAFGQEDVRFDLSLDESF